MMFKEMVKMKKYLINISNSKNDKIKIIGGCTYENIQSFTSGVI